MTESPHPLLPPATPVLDVDAETLQVGGVDGGPGLRVRPAEAVRALLRRFDGRRSERSLRNEAAGAGLTGPDVDALLAGLRAAGLLHELSPADLLAAEPGPAAGSRAASEWPAALPLPGTAGRWRARRESAVVVDGASRVGVPLAAVLAASGVGRVHVRDRGPAAAADAVVGGTTAADEGRPRALAAADAVRRVSPLTDLRPLPAGEDPDLVVLCRPWAAADPLAGGVHRDGVPHLVATVRGEVGVVGPLVLPGATSCLRCADLWRRDEDPAWPRLAAQLAGVEPPPSGATVTCLLTATLAAVQVLAHLDGDRPAALGTTLELRPPGLLPRSRHWPPHPGCPCGASIGHRTGHDGAGATDPWDTGHRE
ncbi:thiamine biosynthesis protein ThiF [Modestobacter sp. NPDC049651]|uniref:ThiF family adenylyltransferase n=1 Tax=unclassified Modestobacter TaxID=2643866 RepID=UPI0034016731